LLKSIGKSIKNYRINRFYYFMIICFFLIEPTQRLYWHIKNIGIEIDNSKGGINEYYYVGGIAGGIEYSNISNSYSMGNISGSSNVGGIVGRIIQNSNIANNIAANPSIRGTSEVNSIVGYDESGSTIFNNLALDTMLANGVTVSDDYYINGESKSEAELKTQSTYESLGWLFGDDNANPWKIDANSSYPYLYWQE
jgi:hypothetical protein